MLAFGNRARLDLSPGMVKHALPLKTVGDAMAIRNAVLRRGARIQLETDAEARRALGHFVIVGSGFSGMELAGELVDCLRSILRYQPRVAADDLQVSVLQDLDRLLPELPKALGDAALKSLRQRGMQVRLNTRAAEVLESAVNLASGERLAAATVLSTIGTQPNALLAALGLQTERGRITVNADRSVPGHAGHLGLGRMRARAQCTRRQAGPYRRHSLRCAKATCSPRTCSRR